ncbi:hypothetical protein [uncultured Winogradskyella sp.]|nr:hypothetical protein [uncultured Winogradskyella sp.]
MTRKKRGMLTTLLVLGVVTILAAFNASKITAFVSEKLPFIGKIFNK